MTALSMKKIIRFLLFTFISYLILIGGAVSYIYFTLPDVSVWKHRNPPKTALMEYRLEENRHSKRPAHIDYQWISISQIPPLLQRTVIVSEDAAFWGHQGIDWYEVRQSLKKNLLEGKFARGGSTITQQVAKNLYLSPEKKMSRKLREWLIAKALEKHLSKTRILELYFNIIEWGKNIFGVKAASLHYFHKMPEALDLDEMVRMAAVIPNPIQMEPDRVTYPVYWRSMVILRRMDRYNFISQGQFEINSSFLKSLWEMQK